MSMTAKQFQEPLLRILGEMTGCKAGVPVRAEDTYAPVMAILGIQDIGEFGLDPATQVPLVQKLVQLANKNLRNGNLTELLGRGQWALTQEGVVELSKTIPVTPFMVRGSNPISTVAVTPAMKVPVLDVYIASLQAAQTPCFGHHTSHGSAECCTCPLAVLCQDKQYENYAEIARGFRVAVAPIATPIVATVVKSRKDATYAGLEMIMAHEAVDCTECGMPIAAGEKCLWKDDIASGAVIMLHQGCLGSATT